jgi:hypothetical protein
MQTHLSSARSLELFRILEVLGTNIARERLFLKGAHTRASLASESGWAQVPLSQTRPCVECHDSDFGGLNIRVYAYMYIKDQDI